MEAVPLPPWRTRKAPARQPLSQDQIVDVGLRILDAEGLEALSMRRIAQELGTGPASLYAHVANKEELLELLFERVMGEIEVPTADGERWLEQLDEVVWAMHRVLHTHADVARVPLANIPMGPNALRVCEGLLSIMLAGGLPPQVAAWAIDRLYLYVMSDAYEGSLYLAKQRASGKDVDTFLKEFFGPLRDYYLSLPPERFPAVTGNIDALMTGSGEERFAFGLELFLRGLKTYTT
ncbi:transcriptional regulator [Planotetraspora thailandica]|uniref:Transcriptional regulator n=1 Tax=Planotetraspora thailandica TaxID=487172 RepID=A0A8J3XYP4_9ACTN|nr:TetR/AcrR family transcriptional regulator [Planotetraspora thailandica]GII54768.1 transcriptional regulator [Planotetraspora thailandica]